MTSSTTGAFSSQSVSPVVVTETGGRRDVAAVTSLMSSRLFACIRSRRPIRSRLPLAAL